MEIHTWLCHACDSKSQRLFWGMTYRLVQISEYLSVLFKEANFETCKTNIQASLSRLRLPGVHSLLCFTGLMALSGTFFMWFSLFPNPHCPLSTLTAFDNLTITFVLMCSVWLFATPWTVARQALLPMRFFQARILEWVAISSSRGSSGSRDWNCISYGSCIPGRFFFSLRLYPN